MRARTTPQIIAEDVAGAPLPRAGAGARPAHCVSCLSHFPGSAGRRRLQNGRGLLVLLLLPPPGLPSFELALKRVAPRPSPLRPFVVRRFVPSFLLRSGWLRVISNESWVLSSGCAPGEAERVRSLTVGFWRVRRPAVPPQTKTICGHIEQIGQTVSMLGFHRTEIIEISVL